MQYVVESEDLESLIAELESRDRNFLKVQAAYERVTKPAKGFRYMTSSDFVRIANEWESLQQKARGPHVNRYALESEARAFWEKNFGDPTAP